MNIKYFQLETIYSRAFVKACQLIISKFYPSEILEGKFKNTPLIKNWVGSSMLPKILGSYESEAAEEIFNIITNQNIDSVIDIGCAGGYYLAVANQLNPNLSLVGIDISSKAEVEIKKYNDKFGTSIQFIKDHADQKYLIDFANRYSHPFFILDIDGG